MLFINKTIFYIYILVTLTPILSSSYLEFALATLWIVTALPLHPFIKKDWKLVILIWIIYAVILRVIGFSSASWGNYGIYILFYFPLFVFYFYRERLNECEKKRIMIFILIVALSNMLYNTIFLINNPGANLELNFSDLYSGMNIGNSGFTFIIMLVLIFCACYVLQGRKMFILPFVIGLFYLVISSKTTSFLIFLIILYILSINIVLTKISRTQRIIIIIIGIIALIFIYREGLDFLVHVIRNEYIVERINALIQGDTGSTYLSRLELAKISLNTFSKHPIFGIGYVKADFALISYTSTGIGHHSEFIDHLGRYGIIGAVFYLLIWINYYKSIQKMNGSKDSIRIANMMFVAFLVTSFLNNSMDAMSGIIIFYLALATADGQFDQINCSNNINVTDRG